jgi:hypothetical protein
MIQPYALCDLCFEKSLDSSTHASELRKCHKSRGTPERKSLGANRVRPNRVTPDTYTKGGEGIESVERSRGMFRATGERCFPGVEKRRSLPAQDSSRMPTTRCFSSRLILIEGGVEERVELYSRERDEDTGGPSRAGAKATETCC